MFVFTPSPSATADGSIEAPASWAPTLTSTSTHRRLRPTALLKQGQVDVGNLVDVPLTVGYGRRLY